MSEKLAVIKINDKAKMVMSHGGKNELKVFNECYNPATGAVEVYEVKFSF